MSKCIYRNDKFGYSSELPALPEYDETEYPYAHIMSFNVNGPQYYLTLMPRDARLDTPDDASVSYEVSHYLMYDCRGIDDAWDGPTYCEGGHIYVAKPFLEFPENGFYTLWSNFDIYNDMGLYCPASDPIPVEEKKTFCLRSWLTGFALGLAGKPLPLIPVSKKEPIAYLYNGVRLPKLPEWDREMYPYAVIEGYVDEQFEATPNSYKKRYLFVSKEPFIVRPGSGISTKDCLFLEPLSNVPHWTVNYGENDGGWVAEDEGYLYNDRCVYDPWLSNNKNRFMWSNHDVLKTDGTIWCAAYDPIPVYD